MLSKKKKKTVRHVEKREKKQIFLLLSLSCFQWFTRIPFIYYFSRRFTALPLVDYAFNSIIYRHSFFHRLPNKEVLTNAQDSGARSVDRRGIFLLPPPPSIQCTDVGRRRGKRKTLVEKVSGALAHKPLKICRLEKRGISMCFPGTPLRFTAASLRLSAAGRYPLPGFPPRAGISLWTHVSGRRHPSAAAAAAAKIKIKTPFRGVRRRRACTRPTATGARRTGCVRVTYLFLNMPP